MSTIEYLGHSGIAVEHEGHLLLCDPWFTGKGAYNASWFPYPKYPQEDLSHFHKPSAVYISHEHLDHYDPEFLENLDRDVPILTGRVHKKRLVAKLRKSGFTQIHELDDFESYEIAPDFIVKVSTPTFHCPPHWFDSCALIEVGGKKIFNLNDCNLALPVDQLREEKIDILMAQASPAIWYPLVYTCYDEQKKAELKAARRESAIESFIGSVKALQPKFAVPFAGPPIFFDEELADIFLEEDSMFPTPAVAAGILQEEGSVPCEPLKPGDKLFLGEADGFPIERTPAYADFDYERDRQSYFDQHKEEAQASVRAVLDAIPEAGADLFKRFRRHFLPILKGHPYFVNHINMRVLFDVTGPEGGKWVVDFRLKPKEELVYEWDEEPCQYELQFESRYLEQILNDELSWEDLFLSLRFRASRNPDVYSQHLFTVFKMSDHRALQAITDAELEMASDEHPEMFDLEVEGKTVQVQRFCPHGGSDMSEAEVEDGFIICPGHHWRFSLTTGDCENADCKIKVEPAD